MAYSGAGASGWEAGKFPPPPPFRAPNIQFVKADAPALPSSESVVGILDQYFGPLVFRAVQHKREARKILFAAQLQAMTMGPERVWAIAVVDEDDYNPQLKDGTHLRDLVWTSLQLRSLRGWGVIDGKEVVPRQRFHPPRRLEPDPRLVRISRLADRSVYRFEQPIGNGALYSVELMHPTDAAQNGPSGTGGPYPDSLSLSGALDTHQFIAMSI